MLKNILYSVLWNKCPRCHKGDVFKTNNPYNLKKFDKMYETCFCCSERYEREPGYFYGAMYVSYGLMVGWFVITWATNTFIVEASTEAYLIFLSVTVVFFTPLTFRISRLLWMNMFTKYDKTKG
ncbi:MAG: DUF983 domain-containing protein [Bacteroidia bacterium]|jgi:uncharacterized protein (DUF983 family)